MTYFSIHTVLFSYRTPEVSLLPFVLKEHVKCDIYLRHPISLHSISSVVWFYCGVSLLNTSSVAQFYCRVSVLNTSSVAYIILLSCFLTEHLKCGIVLTVVFPD